MAGSWPVYSPSVVANEAAAFASSPATALRLPAVRRAVVTVARDLARTNICLYRGDGEYRAKVYDAPELDILNVQANEYQSAFEARQWLTATVLLHGNAFAVISRRGDALDSLICLNPWDVTLTHRPDGRPVYNTSEYGEVDHRDILHLRMPATRRQFWGVSPIADCARSLQLMSQLETAGIEAYRMAGLGKLSITTEEAIGAESVRAMQDAFKSAHSGAEGMLRPIIAQNGAKVDQVGQSLVDQDWIQGRTQAIEDVARALGVPPFVLFTDQATYTAENARMYAESLHGFAASFAAEIRSKLFDEPGLSVAYDFTTIQRGSFVEAMQGYREAIQLGVMTPNEVRSELGMPPVDGGDDMYVGPNMLPGGSDDNETPDSGGDENVPEDG